MAQIRLVRSFMTVGGWTLISRIFGFIRDMMIAAYLGAGPVAEAFLVAFSLPNMFRRIFAEGAFNTAFVPIFAKKYQSDQGAEPFAQDAFSGQLFNQALKNTHVFEAHRFRHVVTGHCVQTRLEACPLTY